MLTDSNDRPIDEKMSNGAIRCANNATVRIIPADSMGYFNKAAISTNLEADTDLLASRTILLDNFHAFTHCGAALLLWLLR